MDETPSPAARRGASARPRRAVPLPRLADRLGLAFELRQGAGRQELRIRLGDGALAWEIPGELARVGAAPVRATERAEGEAGEPGRCVEQGVCVVGRGGEAIDFFVKCHLRGALALELHGARLRGRYLLRRQPLRPRAPAEWLLSRPGAG